MSRPLGIKGGKPATETVPMTTIAYNAIRSRIFNNHWPPGFQVTELEVALQFGMSRTPVREALMRLQQEGLVVVVPRHGMRVLPISPEDMREIYEIVTALEATAAELVAVQSLTAAQLKSLDDATSAMEVSLQQGDLPGWAEADERFHQGLIALCGNRMLVAVVSNCWDRLHRARMLTLKLRPPPTASTLEHRNLVEAIRNRDGAAAFEIHRAHRQRAQRELLDVLQRLGLKQL